MLIESRGLGEAVRLHGYSSAILIDFDIDKQSAFKARLGSFEEGEEVAGVRTSRVGELRLLAILLSASALAAGEATTEPSDDGSVSTVTSLET